MRNQAGRDLRAELERVQARVDELEATIKAIHSGEVDAIVVDGAQGSGIFTLQSPEEPYRVLAERMNEGAATLTTEGTILFCNQRFAEMVRVPAERLLSSNFISMLCEEERSGFPQLVRQALRNNVRTEGNLLRNCGTMLPVQLSLSPIPLEESGQGICLIATDISGRKLVEEKLRTAIDDLKRAQDELRLSNEKLEQRVQERTTDLVAVNKELEAFAYAVAHDLRAPLRHIHGFSDLLLHDGESTLSVDSRHWLNCILNGTSRMEKLLEDLLNLSRLGRQPVNRRTIPLKTLVQEVIDDLAAETSNRQIEWKLGDLPPANCDPALLRIVFVNLLSNAIKFTRPRSTATIEVGHSVSNGKLVLFVRDNGAGFEMKYVGKLFGVFQRLHLEKDFEGTGIGLATVNRILQKHGGQIWAEAELDKGATFYFTVGGEEVIEERQVALVEAV
jgi:PAS domain S-box-containing protein